MRMWKEKKGINKGVAKVPVVMQLEVLECGAACLAMIMAYYNKWIPLEEVRIRCGVSRDGSTAINIIKAARYYDFEAKGFRLETEALIEKGIFPCIIHWNFNHFVVLEGFKGNRAYLSDPARGRYSVSMDDFDDAYTGICLMFEPAEAFEPSGSRASIAGFIKKRVSGLKTPLIFSIVATMITSVIGIISPVFDRIFYDRLLTGKNPEWFVPFIIALSGLYFLWVIVEALNALTNIKLNGKMNVVGSLSYVWKVLHLPVNFFHQRMTGDIVSRQSSNALIANTLVNSLSPMLLNSLMMVFYLLIMIRYSWVLTLIGVLSMLINVGVSIIVSKKRVDISRVLLRDNGKLYSSTVAGIQMIDTIKASGAEEGFFQKWSGNYASYSAIKQKYNIKNSYFELFGEIISTAAGSLIIGIGVLLTMKGEFTLGSITAFQGFFIAFMNPVSELINSNQVIQEMRSSMERIEDVMSYPEDENIKRFEIDESISMEKLSGAVEINNIKFGYSPLDSPLIENFSLSLKPGSSVALVGASGCGKSTVSRLISGLYSPWEGEILFDGKRVDEIDHNVFAGSVVVVDQEIVLFRDTIENNIKMWDDSIEDFEMILAAKDAQIHYEIVNKSHGYQHILSEDGKDFSGGQRQRLEIARVLAQEPNIVILDEATSALDAKTEYEVVKAIRARGITCIVIAHRLSTVRDCDEIIVLDKGKVVERGTNDELMSLKGYYCDLVSNE